MHLHTIEFNTKFTALVTILAAACGGTSPNSTSQSTAGTRGHDANGGTSASQASAHSGNGGASASTQLIAETGGTAFITSESPSSGGVVNTSAGAESTSIRAISGDACTVVNERACSGAATEAVLYCGNDLVWHLADACSAEAKCGGSPARCITDPSVCADGEGEYCDDDIALAVCDPVSRAPRRSVCPSRMCRNDACSEWDPCGLWHSENRRRISCFPACSRAGACSVLRELDYGVSLQASYFQAPTETICDVAVPAAKTWRWVDACEDVVTYVIKPVGDVDFEPVELKLEAPEQYWLLSGTSRARSSIVEDHEAVSQAACTAVPSSGPYAIEFTPDTFIVIATRDLEAPGFWLSVQAL